MSLCRALALVALLIAVPSAVQAQFGGMPGMPGSPGFGAPSTPPPACQELISLQKDAQKHANAIQNASKRKAPPGEACKLFRSFLSVESKMIRAFERNGPQCGVPSNMPQEMKKGHVQAEKIAKQVCDVAAQASRPATPSLSDAFGGAPILPDANNTKKQRGGAFDSLTGNVLER
jgi:hypothetical protein